MKIVFVLPNYEKAFSCDPSYKPFSINHGIGLLSACVKKQGHETYFIDLKDLKDWNHYKERLLEINPQVVGITCMTIDLSFAKKSAEIAKKTLPEAKVVIGGIHVSLVPEDIISNKSIDYIILGEGEISFPKLISDLENGKTPKRIIQGIRPDLDSLPFVDRDLFKYSEHSFFECIPDPFVTIISSRGCHYNCNFCQPAEKKMFGKKVRRRSVDNVIAELKLLRKKMKIRSFMIHDDCLTEAQEWVKEFCQKYKANGFNQNWICQARVDHICRYPEIIKLMRDSGLRAVHVGFESGSQRTLNFLRKGTTIEQNYEARRILKRNGIKIVGMFMVGIPTETKEDVKETIKMMKIMELEAPSLAFFTPYPGSDLYTYCKENNLLAITDYKDYNRAKKTPKIKGIDYDYLLKMYRKTIPFKRRLKDKIKSVILTYFGEKTLDNLKKINQSMNPFYKEWEGF